jgi:hypothetical protein
VEAAMGITVFHKVSGLAHIEPRDKLQQLSGGRIDINTDAVHARFDRLSQATAQVSGLRHADIALHR